MKHAYLIIAHNEFEVLKLLISKLDDERNDIYVHIDKKVKTVPVLSIEKSRLHILDKRIDVRWGHVSQIETELLLFETALANGSYSYYHLISGTHLPLKTQDEIHSIYYSLEGNEVMRLWPEDAGDADFKLRRYHLFRSLESCHCKPISFMAHLLYLASMRVQIGLGMRRRKRDRFVKSDNWVSLTDTAVSFLVNNKKKILCKYRYTFCGDEYFVASELCDNADKFKIRDMQNLLYVEFVHANPRAFALNEYQRLCETGYVFARKFTGKSNDNNQ